MLHRAAQELAKDSVHSNMLLFFASHADLEQDQQGIFGEQAEALTQQQQTCSPPREKRPANAVSMTSASVFQSVHAQQAQGLHAHVVSGHQDTDKCSCLGFSGWQRRTAS